MHCPGGRPPVIVITIIIIINRPTVAGLLLQSVEHVTWRLWPGPCLSEAVETTVGLSRKPFQIGAESGPKWASGGRLGASWESRGSLPGPK